LNVYFAGSIRGAEPDLEWFHRLILYIKRYARVMTEHSFDLSYEEEINKDDVWIYNTDIGWLRESDGLIAEVTAPSLGVGYEIAKAEEWGIPILLLYRNTPNKAPSAMLRGNKNLRMVIYEDEEDAFKAIEDFLSSLPNNDQHKHQG